MNRTTWIAVVLLLATNAAWVVAWLGEGGASGAASVGTSEHEVTIADLREEVALLRRSKAGAGAGAADDAEASDAIDYTEGPGDGPGLEITGRKPDPEDERLAAERRTAEEQAAEKQAREKALASVKAMMEKALQVKDPALREEGLRELADVLATGDDMTVEYALGALWSVRGLEFDRAGFRRLVEAHLDSEHPGVRRSALYGLKATLPQEGDLRLALAGVEDPSPVVRRHIGRILRQYTDGKLEGDVSAAFVTLLSEDDRSVRRETMRGLWNTTATPEIEGQLIALAKRPEERKDAVYFGLSTLENKSRPVVDSLFTHLKDDNPKIRQRAHWGLQRGIRKNDHAYVARRYAEHLDTFVNPKTHREVLKIVARYGDESAAPQLDRFAENEMVNEGVRELARRAAEYLRNKGDGPR